MLREMILNARMPGASSNAERGQALAQTAATQLARDQAREQHGGRAGQSGQETGWPRANRPARTRSSPRDQRDQRRLIHVAPGEVPRAGQVVQLVDEIAVVPAGIEVHREFGGGDERNHQPRADEPGLAGLCGVDIVHSSIVM